MIVLITQIVFLILVGVVGVAAYIVVTRENHAKYVKMRRNLSTERKVLRADYAAIDERVVALESKSGDKSPSFNIPSRPLDRTAKRYQEQTVVSINNQDVQIAS